MNWFNYVVCLVALSCSLSAFAGEGRNGGFVDDSARVILKKTSQLLSKEILEYSSGDALKAYFIDFMGGVPSKYNKQELARVITDVRFGQTETRRRNGRELMFDYGYQQGKPYIIALKPFFVAYLAWTDDQFTPQLITSLMEKLLHEASHFWGYDDVKAKSFAKTFVYMFDEDGISCVSQIDPKEGFSVSISPHAVGFNSFSYLQFAKATPTFTAFRYEGHYDTNYVAPKGIYELDPQYLQVPSTSSGRGDLLHFEKVSENTFSGAFEVWSWDGRKIGNPTRDLKYVTVLPEADFSIEMDSTWLHGVAVIRSTSFKQRELKFDCQSNIISSMDQMRPYFSVDN